MSEWSSFGECSTTCGKGEQIRRRECNGNGACEGNLYETKECLLKSCPGKEFNNWKPIVVNLVY